ncbi:MAG: hypothetical protein Q7S16_01355 [bacterium]|nr:hypothetical protein [bacterium]
MTFRGYLFFMGAATVLCWSAVLAVLYAVDPSTSGVLGILLFYGSLLLALVGTLALFGIIVRKLLFREEPHFVHVAIAFRQSILFALLIVALLLFAHAQLLRWWLILVLITFFTVIEYLLLSIFERHSTT